MSQEKTSGSQDVAASQKEPRGNKPVVHYILILFIAAFLLMALSFLMHQRSNTEALGALQNSVTAMQEVQASQEKIIQLQEELDEAKEALNAVEEALQAAQATEIDQLQEDLRKQTELAEACRLELDRTVRAMDLFWQIDEAYVLGRHTRCRELIQTLEAEALASALPTVSTTDNDRFSPYDRYAEICEALGEPYGNGAPS